MPTFLPDLDFASLSDVGQRRLANEDACHCDERMGLFVVCDGIGGQPSGEAASHIIAHAMGHLIRRRLRHIDAIRPGTLEKILVEVVGDISLQMYEHSQAIPVLQGMGATIVAALVDARTLYLAHAGDSRGYLLREGKLEQLTEDHTRSYRRYADDQTMTDQQAERKERRLLMSYVGSNQRPEVGVTTLVLNVHDRLLLCSDGLTDPVDDATIGKQLAAAQSPAETCQRLINLANAGGGPDNITTIVMDFKGIRSFDASQRRSASTPVSETKHGVVNWFHTNLKRIEQTMQWLREGTDEASHPERLRAMAAVKRRLGPTVFRDFLKMQPTQNPSHVFHQAAVSPNSPWRQQYEQVMGDLEPNYNDITSGGVRLSPLLTSDETGLIIRSLWRDWRKVEQRYFKTCTREAISESEQTLTILVDHMLSSVRTLIGLLEFFPRFMRDAGSAGSDGDASPASPADSAAAV